MDIQPQVSFVLHFILFYFSHLEIADEGGQFVANCNLGMCFGLLGDFTSATNYHQEALRIAIRLKVSNRSEYI